MLQAGSTNEVYVTLVPTNKQLLYQQKNTLTFMNFHVDLMSPELCSETQHRSALVVVDLKISY